MAAHAACPCVTGMILVTILRVTQKRLQECLAALFGGVALLGALPGALAFFGLLGETDAAASRQQLARLPPFMNRKLWAAQIPVCNLD